MSFTTPTRGNDGYDSTVSFDSILDHGTVITPPVTQQSRRGKIVRAQEARAIAIELRIGKPSSFGPVTSKFVGK